MQQVPSRTGACLFTHPPPWAGPCPHPAAASLVPSFVPALSHPFLPSTQGRDCHSPQDGYGPPNSCPLCSHSLPSPIRPQAGSIGGDPGITDTPRCIQAGPRLCQHSPSCQGGGRRPPRAQPQLTRMMLWQVVRGSPTRLVPLTDMRRSPMLSSPDLSAGPPCIRLAMTTVGRMEPQPDSTMAMPRISPFCFRMQTW